MQLEQELLAPSYDGNLDALALCQQTCGCAAALPQVCWHLLPFKEQIANRLVISAK